MDSVLALENILQTNLIPYLSVQTFKTFSDHRVILLKILWKYPTRIDETKTSNCTLEDKQQRLIWNNKLAWKDFNELQTKKIENINIELENLLSNVEDTFKNTTGKVLRKTKKHKESQVKNSKIRKKNGLAKLTMTNIISKS